MKNLLTKTRGIGTFTHQSTVATSELLIANIVEAEELDFILEDEGTSEDEEEEEVLFDIHHLDDIGDECDFDDDTHLENSD